MLDLKGNNEKIINGRNVMVTSLGRVYINPNTVSNYTYDQNQLNYMDFNGNRHSVGLKQVFPSYGERYSNITYVYQNIIQDVRSLEFYLGISNNFLKMLIENKLRYSFEGSVEYFFKLYNFRLSQSDAHSLLKPVYFRYAKIKDNNSNLEKVRIGLENIYSIKKVILYDVLVEVINSQLRILDRFSIGLSEEIDYNSEVLKFHCISMGDIKKFDRVEIEIENYEIARIIFNGDGYM